MKVPNTKENFKKCICAGCPTYNPCMKDDDLKLFCSRGQTDCKPEHQGCICGECPIASEFQLRLLYYCHDPK